MFRTAQSSGKIALDLTTAVQVCIHTHHILLIVTAAILNSRDIIRALEAAGWREVARVGSHAQFKHPTPRGRVTVPHPSKDIPLGTLRSIEKQSGLKLR